MNPIIPQIIGILAVATFLLSYQQRKRGSIILCNTVSRCLYILQYLLLGAFSGAALDVLGALASIIAARRDHRLIRRHLLLVVTVIDLAILTVGLLLYRSPVDLLPIAGVLLHTGAFWLSDERRIRVVSFLGSPFWFVYNFSSAAYGSAIGDILTMISIAVAMIRYRKNKGSAASASSEKENA